MKITRSIILAALVIFVPLQCAQAWRNGVGGSIGKHAATININAPGSGTLDGTYYLNALKSAGGFTFIAPDNPGMIDVNGYPSGTFTNDLAFNTIFSGETTQTVTWVLKWPSTRTVAALFFNNGIANITQSGCTASTTGFTTTITGSAGQACRVTFTWIQQPGNLGMSFKAGTYGGSGEIVLARLSDEAAITQGGYFTPESMQRIVELGAYAIRVMPQVMSFPNNYTNLTQWRYRKTPTSFSFLGSSWAPGAWAGTISGTDSYTVDPPPDDANALPDGYTLQGKFTNAATTISVSGAATNGGNVQLTVNATATLSPAQSVFIAGINGTTEANGVHSILTVDSPTTVTINVAFVHAYSSGGKIGTQTLTINGRAYGTKFIACLSGNDVTGNCASGAQIAAGMNATLVYDSLLDVFLYIPNSGISRQVPIEVLVALANISQSILWLNVPMKADDTFITNEVQYARDNLINGLNLEYDNEIWNFAFPVTQWASARASALGWGADPPSYYGYAIRHMMGVAQSAWAPRSLSQLRGVLAVQGCCPGGTSNVQSSRFNGTKLNEDTFPNYCTFVGGTFSGTCSVHLGYNSAPNRPVDFSALIADAPYSGGGNYANPDSQTYATSHIGQAAFLQNVANLYNAGDTASIAQAMALLDSDFRAGTQNVQTATVGGASNDTFTIGGTNYANGNTVVFTTTGTLLANLSLNVPYFVRDVSGSTFKVSASCLSSDGSGGCGSEGAAITGITGGSGTLSVGKIPGITTAFAYAATIWPFWESIAAGYDAQRAGFAPALAPLGRQSYEGGFSPQGPTTSDCTTLGVLIGGSAATASTVLANALTAYKNNLTPNYGMGIELWNMQLYTGTASGAFNAGTLCTNSRACTPNHFELTGGVPYALLPGNIYTAPFQNFYGFKAFQFP